MSNLSKTFSKIPPSSVTSQVTTLADDDPIDGVDLFEEGRDDLDYMSSTNAVNINRMSCSPSADVYNAEPLLTLKDPDALRAQIDTGADVSCTDQLHMLHQYREFDEAFPSPIKMMGGIVHSNAAPKGHGYLHIPAHNERGFLAVRTFYTPLLRITVVDERDLFKAAGHKAKDMMSEKITKHYDTGTFTYHARHKLKSTKDVIMHGVLLNGKCYTNALIPPDASPDSDKATVHNSSVLAMQADPAFAKECKKATLYAMCGYQEAESRKLQKEMSKLPTSFHSLPFHEYIQQNTPVSTIKTSTKRLLWHQRLCHPSDYYLYNAHKHVDGVPSFQHMDRILDVCPTCIRAKQTKEPAGPNTTRTATQPYQGISIDFSFSGTRSKNTFNKFPIRTKVEKVFNGKVYLGSVLLNP